MGVAATGAIALTLIPRRANSFAEDFVMAVMAPLAAE